VPSGAASNVLRKPASHDDGLSPRPTSTLGPARRAREPSEHGSREGREGCSPSRDRDDRADVRRSVTKHHLKRRWCRSPRPLRGEQHRGRPRCEDDSVDRPPCPQPANQGSEADRRDRKHATIPAGQTPAARRGSRGRAAAGACRRSASLIANPTSPRKAVVEAVGSTAPITCGPPTEHAGHDLAADDGTTPRRERRERSREPVAHDHGQCAKADSLQHIEDGLTGGGRPGSRAACPATAGRYRRARDRSRFQGERGCRLRIVGVDRPGCVTGKRGLARPTCKRC